MAAILEGQGLLHIRMGHSTSGDYAVDTSTINFATWTQPANRQASTDGACTGGDNSPGAAQRPLCVCPGSGCRPAAWA
jgi:hypothetical protein